MNVSDLPSLNAALNGLAGSCLVAGWVFIRLGRRDAHCACMIAAFVSSAFFLVSYVVYHANAGSKPFPGTRMARSVYFTILITHVVLAAAILPMAIVTLARALRGRFDRHKRIARLTLPIWLYVSVTGVAIYWMLYRMRW